MLNHHIKVAIRNIQKQGVYALLNIVGLSVGLVLGLFVILLVRHELNYDGSFSDSDQIYRMSTEGVLANNLINSATTPMPLAHVLEKMDGVEKIVRFIPGANNVVVKGDVRYNESGFMFGSEQFFELFDLKIIEGNTPVDLSSPRKVVITERVAGMYFQDEAAVGKFINRDGVEYEVVAVCEELPTASHFDFSFVASLNTIDEILLRKGDSAYVENWKSDWMYLNCYTYFKLNKNIDKNEFVKQVNVEKDKLISPQVEEMMKLEQSTDSIELSFFAQSIKSIHFASHLDGELKANSKPIYIQLFVFVAMFVLLTTCVNFMNLTTAKLKVKYREVGYRQLVGATRGQLIMQFLVEALVYGLGAMFIGMVLLELLLPYFNSFFELNLEFNFFRGWIDFFGILIALLLVGLIAGSFPAFFFSGRKPEKLISGNYSIGKAGFVIRGLLVTSQFAVAMFLVVVASAMWWQIDFVRDSEHGYDAQNIMVIERGNAVRKKLPEFKRELLQVEGVKYVSACSSLPGDDYIQGPFRINDVDNDRVVMLPLNYVDEDYFNVLNLRLKAGRFLSTELGDSMGLSLNVAAVKKLKLRKPLEDKLEVFGNSKWSLNTVGVIKDFHYESFFSEIKPLGLLLLSNKMRFEYVLVKTEGVNPEQIEEIKKIWDKYSDGAPFVHTSMSERLNRLYEEEVRIAKIMSVFALLSLFIALLGVIALVAFIIEYKAESIAIKNVIGASRQSIMSQVFSMFGFYVLLGVLFASLPAYWAIKAWASSYAYFDFIGFGAFILWAIVLIALAFVVTFIQTFRGSTLRLAAS